MNVIIINSPLFRNVNNLYDEDSLPPLGLGYIATNLQNNGIDVELIDAVYQRIPLEELIHTLQQKKPEFIAVNIFTTNYDLVKELVESISFNTHLIVGGLSTKQLYSKIIAWNTTNHIDVVTGDGEIITLDIIVGQVKDEPIFTSESRRVYQISESSSYVVHDISDVPLNRKFFKNEPVKHPLGFYEANIVTSRGCIYNCTFCAAARSLNKDYPVRERSEQSIVKELKEINRDYPQVNSIRVLDDLFLKKNTVQKAINIFSGFHYQWRAMAHVLSFQKVTESTMNMLRHSGCNELFIGIESGSPKILKEINKTSDTQQILENLTKVLKAGINIKGYFIYGFPGETRKDMEMTFNLANKLKEISFQYGSNFRTSVFQYRPYHGTQIYHDLDVKGVNLDVEGVKPNKELSNLVGRLQFNFHSGNYSQVDDNNILYDYIYRTINLNGAGIFAGLRANVNAV